MSRFDEADECDPLIYGRWEHNVKATINGKKGQQALRDLRRYLLAMPERLISGWLACPDGEVCTVGLFAAGRRADQTGCTMVEAARILAEPLAEWDQLEQVGPGRYRIREDDLPDHVLKWYYKQGWSVPESLRSEMDDGTVTTVEAGKAAGLTETLAWVLGDLNDNMGPVTPEQRWTRVLEWVEETIAVPAS